MQKQTVEIKMIPSNESGVAYFIKGYADAMGFAPAWQIRKEIYDRQGLCIQTLWADGDKLYDNKNDDVQSLNFLPLKKGK